MNSLFEITPIIIIVIFTSVAIYYFLISIFNKFQEPASNNTEINASDDLLTFIAKKLQLETARRDPYHNTPSYISNIYGHIHGIKINISSISSDFSFDKISITTDHKIEAAIFGNILIKNESSMSHLKKSIGFKDYTMGDAAFDDIILIQQGTALAALSLLNKHIRYLLITLASSVESFELTNETFSLTLRKDTITNQKIKFRNIIEKIAKTSLLISQERDIKKMLMQNINIEVNPTIKMKNLKNLALHYNDDPEVISFLKKLLNNKSIDIQIEAAIHLQTTGLAHLGKLLKKPGRIKKHDLLKIIEFIKDATYQDAIPELKNIYTGTRDRDIKTAILSTFKNFQNKELHPFLIKKLHDSKSYLLIAIIKALGTCGTVDAVEPLLRIEKQFTSNAITNAVQTSISMIQSKLDGVEKGWLSRSEASEKDGALSISNNASDGALSHPDGNDDTSEK